MKDEAADLFNSVIRQLTIQAVFEHRAGFFLLELLCFLNLTIFLNYYMEGFDIILIRYYIEERGLKKIDFDECMDGSVLVDVLMKVFADPCKEVSDSAVQALSLVKETLMTLYGVAGKVILLL